MSLGAFNRALFNRKSGGRAIEERYDMSAAILMAMDVGVRYEVDGGFNASIDGHMDLWWGYYENSELAEAMTMLARAQIRYNPDAALAEEISARFNPVLWALGEMSEAIDWKTMTVTLHLYPEIDPFFASIVMRIDGEQTTETIMELPMLVMQPGSVLVIDSENYTITLDGQNVIHAYQGDWFDFMPELREMAITSNVSGAPRVSVLFEERYL